MQAPSRILPIKTTIMKQPSSEEAMRLRMADLCARTEQCAFDLRMKMVRGGMTAAQIERILEDLRRERFLDETRYARAFARDKVRFAGWGRMKIRQALAAKRLSGSDIDEGLAAIDPDDYRTALQRAAAAKSRQLDLSQYTDRQRLLRHLLSRGFTAEEALREMKC